MKTVELFAGTRSFSTVAKILGHQTFTTDFKVIEGQDLVADIRQLNGIHFPYRPEILWASPPCEGFSVASIGKNWNHNNTPKTDSARNSVELVNETLRLIKELKPMWWFIENPRGKLRKLGLIPTGGVFQHTVTYCQYGDTRMKPTDIWTNAPWFVPRLMCKNGAPCHISAPRGSSTGTQGIKGYKERSRIPAQLFEDIFNQCPNK